VGYALTTFLGIGFTVINGRLQYIRGGYWKDSL
jgi:hypothetical protein